MKLHCFNVIENNFIQNKFHKPEFEKVIELNDALKNENIKGFIEGNSFVNSKNNSFLRFKKDLEFNSNK